MLHHPKFEGIVKGAWRQEYRGVVISRTWLKLKTLKEALRELNTYMASYQQKMNQAKQKLELLQSCQTLIEQEKEAIFEVEKWSNVEEQVLRQKS